MSQPTTLTYEEWAAHAPDLAAEIGGYHFPELKPKQHKTGSLGYRHNGRMTVKVNGRHVAMQVNLTLTVIGSKPPEPPPDAQVTSGTESV